ncbi:MAG: DUF6814 family protein [Chitinophagaceae bacterium]
MNSIKKMLGLVWVLLAPAVIYFLISGAITHIDPSGTKDINNPVVWIIIILIFTPIAVGLFIFGLYALKGEYAKLPSKSDEII